jgi:hypothetical protein
MKTAVLTGCAPASLVGVAACSHEVTVTTGNGTATVTTGQGDKGRR